MLIFVKLGGSLITDKTVASSFREDTTLALAEAFAEARGKRPEIRLLLGHGSGSFGHVVAKQYGTIGGVNTTSEWHGFAEVSAAASTLNHLVSQTMRRANLPIIRLQPSASAIATDGRIASMNTDTIIRALDNDLVPLVHGDVAFDTVRGGTIVSTETVFDYLAHHLPVTQILLLGEVAGVYDESIKVIPNISQNNIGIYRKALGGSAGTDVTGGMFTKVQDMLNLTKKIGQLTIRIMDGRNPQLVRDTLLGEVTPGTLIGAYS